MPMNPCPIALVLAGVAFGFAGCARYQPRPITAEKVAADFDSRTLTDVGLKGFLESNLARRLETWPMPSWDLTNLTLAAFYYHPDLDVARARWAVLSAGQKTAGERPNPVLSVTPAYNTTTHIPSPWLVTPTLDIPIETAGKRGYRLAESGLLSEAARLNITTVAWRVRSGVRSSLLELYSAQESELLLKDQQVSQSEEISLLEQQQAAGAISAFETTQARLAAVATRIAWRDAERRSAEARVRLAEAIGVPTAALDGARLSFADPTRLPREIPLAEARRQALLHRTDILGALAEYAATESALQLEIARQYPDVHLNPGYEFDQGDNKWSLGISVTLPVLNQNQGAIAEAQARRAEAAANFNALQARVVGEIDRAVAAYHTALQKQADTDALRAGLERQEQIGQAMFAAGEISRSDLAALRVQLDNAALARLDALTQSQRILGQLEDALQSPIGLPASAWQAWVRNPESTP